MYVHTSLTLFSCCGVHAEGTHALQGKLRTVEHSVDTATRTEPLFINKMHCFYVMYEDFWRVLYFAIWRRAVRWKSTDVSEEHSDVNHSARCLIPVCFLLFLLFDNEDGGSTFLRIVSKHVPLHGVTSQKIILFRVIKVRTSHLTFVMKFLRKLLKLTISDACKLEVTLDHDESN
jgi:hypothetical protein